MSEMWRELIERQDAELAKSLSLKRVSISKKTGEMTVRLNADRLFTREQFKAVQRALTAAFPSVPLRVRLSYPALREQAERDIASVSPLLIEIVRHESPGSAPFLLNSSTDFSLKDGVFTVRATGEEGVQYMQSRGVDKLLSDILKDLFSIDARTLIVSAGSEQRRLQRIREERLREEERMAAEAAKEVRDTPEKRRSSAPQEAAYGKVIHDAPTPMNEMTEDIGRATVMGEVAALDIRDAKNGQSKIVTFSMTDHLGSVNCKIFLGGRRQQGDASVEQQAEALKNALKDGNWVKARGGYRYDDYRREMVLMVNDVESVPKPVREDEAPKKRVELHAHTQMSSMDACASATDLIKQAAHWGHPAIAITDHGVVQAFPEAFSAAKRNGVKLIPGCEGYLIEDTPQIVTCSDRRRIDETAFVVLDFETTGLFPNADEIIEIGAVRIEGGKEVAEFSQLINPGRPVPPRVVEITGITTSMLAGEPRLESVFPAFEKFLEGAVLVAHNASFDMGFLRRAFKRFGKELGNPVVDTLALARNQFRNLRNHKLATVCKHLGVSLKNAHRAVHDARATGEVLLRTLEEMGVERISDINASFCTDAGGQAHHIILLAKNQVGMTNLYRLVSEGHLKYFHRTPRIPRKLIEKYREGLIVGSACEAGELFRALVAGKDDRTLERIAKFYDYLEVQPVGNNAFLIREGAVKDEDGLRELNRRVVKLGDKLGIPVVATGDVHFLNPEDAIYRTILMASKGFDDADEQPPLYFRTTDDMLREFAYLGKDAARVVVDAPNRIADMVEDPQLFIPHPEGKETFQPFWPEAEGELRDVTMRRARSIYGEELPEIVEKRIDKELGAIIGYGFSTLYMIAVKLVSKSLSDGYIVGSRGSVGSSLVAYLSGITEVNSLPPHYVCPACKKSDFDVLHIGKTGLDLPARDCPACGHKMDKDGFNIPFEVFLGFKGNKVPDIDLNFSGVYQPVAHNYVKELFGKENVFRAGTIGTIAEKTAYGYVLKYMEERELNFTNAEKERLARGITGVKRTTGQHPAGMVVLPKDYEIYQFTPIQHPADDTESETITTHFDFGSMHDVLVKLDVLGHDDPTMLRRLQDLTGIAPTDVPLNDPEVFRKILTLFSSPDALGLTADELGVPTGTLGIPEFGTRFVRGMLVETRPSSMEELIRISGLSHGTDVWVGNTQDLVRQGVPLGECICTRDDIMNALIELGVDSEIAFKAMESVRKGKGLQPFMEEAILAVDAPAWYVDSCKKIKYMFPKAHAVAYVMMGLRIAYFKIFHPAAYYACYLMRNADAFDGTRMVARDVNVLRAMMEEIDALERPERERKDGEYSLLEILVEMNLRGVYVRPVDLYASDATNFLLVDGEILPPITSLPGIGQQAAEALARAREAGAFISQDDMVRRKVPKSVVEALKLAGCLNGLPQSSQVTLFEFGI